MKFDVRFYLVAILFIILIWRLRSSFPGPWCWIKIGMVGYLSMTLFPGNSGDRIYLRVEKGALEWGRRHP